MAEKAVINLSTGLEDAERVTVAFLVAGGALEQGRQVAMFLTKEGVRIALPGVADASLATGRHVVRPRGAACHIDAIPSDRLSFRLVVGTGEAHAGAAPSP